MNLKRNNDSEKELSQQDIDGALPKSSQKDKNNLFKKKQEDADEFEESVEDLNAVGKATGIKSDKEYKDIWDAIHVNDTNKLEKLLGGKEWPTSALFDKDGSHTMLHTAAALGHVESLMGIIEHTGAKPDLLNSNLATPLHFACRNNHDMVAKFLINSGVDINIQDEHGQTCLLICCIHGHKKLAQILIESSIAGNTPEPLDMDLKDNRGLTPLN